MTLNGAPYAYRDQATLRRALCLSVKEAADFTPAGCLKIIERLESCNQAWAKELLTKERRGYCHLYARGSVLPFPKLKATQPVDGRDIMLSLKANRKFGG